MAPKTLRPHDRATTLKRLLDFVLRLQQVLSSNVKPPALAADLYKHIDELTETRLTFKNSARELDEEGTKLWNLSSKLKKTEDASAQLICLVRVLACLLLDCSHRSTVGTNQNAIRVLRAALKTTKLCLDQGHVALAERIVERAAQYEQDLKDSNGVEDSEVATLEHDLSTEYYIMRIALAWRQDRLDLAENWLIKLDIGASHLSPVVTENLADLLYEIGKACNGKAAHEVAVYWLEQAHNIFAACDFEQLSSDAGDLEIAIMHTLARALMKIPGDDSRMKAWKIADDLDSSPSEKLVALILKLDLYEDDLASDQEKYFDVLLRMVRMIHVTDTNFNTVLHYIHRMRSRSPAHAHSVLKEFLLERLVHTEKLEWVERALVIMIWNITTSTGIAHDLKLLKQVLDALQNHSSLAIGSSATHAAHILLWKCIENCYNRDAHVDTVAWCHIALHRVFDRSSELNIGKMQRKLILCTMALSDYATARSIYSDMSIAVQSAPETQYLMYKIGLRSGDVALASECLENVYRGSSKDATLLYACVLEAQHTGQRAQAISAMQLVLDKYNYESPPGVNLPALLRCTARLLIHNLGDSKENTDSIIDAICKLFEGAAAQAKRSRRDTTNQIFSISELDWFSRNTYNLGLKFCAEWSPSQTLRIINACLKFIDLYPTDMDTNMLSDLSLRRMFCDFLASSLLIMLARKEDVVEDQLQLYLSVRKHVTSFQAQLQVQMSSLQGGAKDDLSRKASALLTFDFEAAVRLKAWDDVSQLVKDSQYHEDPKLYAIIADIMLSSDAPTETIIVTLQQIVNISWRLDGIDMVKLARWVRCLFQLALTTKNEIAEFLLDQVSTLAQDAKMSYPAEELEWLATTTFNRAVDFYCASQDEACKRWAEKALEVAKTIRDGGQLRELLETKYLGLRWEK